MAISSNNHGAGLHRPLADINVTPLVDVMLVLLIVFMITAPMLNWRTSPQQYQHGDNVVTMIVER